MIVSALAVAVAATEIRAAEDTGAAKPAQKSPAPELKEMTLTGVVEKVENKKKDGSPMMTWFTLTGEDGIVAHLPKGKVEEFVGMKVKLVGMGFDTTKRGKPARTIETIKSIQKAEGAQ
jgi:hypothetical protein